MAARQITQQTFDAIVLENIEEFEMSPEEAVKEAVQQFEAQGVNLDFVIKVYQPKNEDGKVVHAVERSVEKLRTALEQNTCDPASISAACDALLLACSVSLADRCLAAKSGAYDLLLNGLDMADAAGDASCLLSLLTTLRGLIDGQPDVLDDHGATRLVEMIQASSVRMEILACLLTIVRRCCVLHEGNRQRFVTLGIILATTNTLRSNRAHRDVVRAACTVFSALTLDDDIRVPFGKGHEHAKSIVVEGDALGLLIDIATDYVEDSEVLTDVFGVIGRLSVRDEFCKKVLDLGGITSILSVLQANMKNQSLVRNLLFVMKTLSGSDIVKTEIVRAGGMALIIEAVRTHQYNAGVCEAGCAALASIVLRFPEHADTIVEANGPEVICTTMELHSSSSSVQKQGCMAVRNIVARRTDLSAIFLSLGAEKTLRQTLATHATCHDEAHAALRDLGCNVNLKELWTGSGRQLQQ